MISAPKKEDFLEGSSLPFDLYDAYGACQDHFLHYHDCLELNYVLSGAGINYNQDRKYLMRPGELYFINSQECHIAVSTEQLRMKVLIFQPSFIWQSNPDGYDYLRPFFDHEKGWDNCVDAGEQRERVLQLLMWMEEEKKRGEEDSPLFIRAYLMELLACVCRERSRQQGDQRWIGHRQAYQRIEPAITYIRPHFSQEITLEQLARMTCMSRTYFCAYFKRATGMNVREYLRLTRINYARLLMTTTDCPVTEICYRCGYNSLSSFNEAFRQLCFTTPTEYRRALDLCGDNEKS